MKAGLAANLFAFDAITAAGLSPAAPIHLQPVVKESTGNGALSALLRGYTGDAVLIPEPVENALVRTNVGEVSGGDWPSSIPSWCEISVRAAIYPWIDPEQAWEE